MPPTSAPAPAQTSSNSRSLRKKQPAVAASSRTVQERIVKVGPILGGVCCRGPLSGYHNSESIRMDRTAGRHLSQVTAQAGQIRNRQADHVVAHGRFRLVHRGHHCVSFHRGPATVNGDFLFVSAELRGDGQRHGVPMLTASPESLRGANPLRASFRRV